MNSDSTPQTGNKTRKLIRIGVTFLVISIVLHFVAEPLATEITNRSEHGYVSMLDEERMSSLQFASDKLSWLGLGLILVGSAGWMNRPEDVQEPG